jgi:hypothetical protein
MEFTALSSLEIRDLLNKYYSDLRKLEFQAQQTKAIIEDLTAQVNEIESILASDTAPQTAPQVASKPAPEAPKAETKAAAPAAKEKEAAPATKEKAAAPATKEKAADTGKKTGRKRGRPPGSTKAKSQEKATTETKAKADTPAESSPAKKPAAAKKGTEKKRGPGRPPGSKNKKTSAAKPKTPPTKKPATKAEKIAAEAPGYRASDWDLFVLDSITQKQRILTTSQLTDIGVAKPEIKIGAAQIKSKLNRSLHKLANQKGLLVKVKHDGRGFAYGLVEWLNENGELPKKYAYTD